MVRVIGTWALLAALPLGSWTTMALAAEPPAINPFGPPRTGREDAIPGYIELSDGSIHPGQIYLTRDARLRLLDEKLQRQREIPLQAVKQVEGKVQKEWMEKEWKFKEAASDEKMYTGRTYPVREYVHTVTLRDDRTIGGELSGIVYVQPDAGPPVGPGAYRPRVQAERYLLHKRDKGKIGEKLESLVYVKWIKLGDEALAEARKKAAGRGTKGDKPKS